MDAEKLRLLVSYDPATGECRWLQSRGKGRAGQLVGCMNSRGYLVTRIDGKNYKLHRLIWLWVHGEWPR